MYKKRKNTPFTEDHKKWQEIRRGRYVEFNLIHDKGTLFGLKTKGRIESILMSLPPKVRWEYNVIPDVGSAEEKLITVLRNPKKLDKMIVRPRILRKSMAIRAMVAESKLSASDFIAPLFIVEGEGIEEEISSLPNYYRRSLDLTLKEVESLWLLGIKSVLLFIKCPDHLKDNEGVEALNSNGLMRA